MESPLINFALEDLPPVLNIRVSKKIVPTHILASLKLDLKSLLAEGELKIEIKLNTFDRVIRPTKLDESLLIDFHLHW